MRMCMVIVRHCQSVTEKKRSNLLTVDSSHVTRAMQMRHTVPFQHSRARPDLIQ